MNTKLKEIIKKEEKRQQETIDLIASENFTSKAVRDAVGSVLMHKYSEGYIGARYYEGNENIDELESLCIEMVKKIMLSNENPQIKKSWSVNVQAPTGSIANMAVYNAVLEPGDKILSMYLPDGGHLSHGWSYTKTQERDETHSLQNNSMSYYGGKSKITLVSKIFNIVQYKTDPKTNLFDYDFIEELALKENPNMIITGGTAYPRDINYKRISEIAKKVGALYLADIAHEAGLIASGVLSSPFEYADFVTFTTHKTLRGPKGAVIMCRNEFIKAIDRSIMPGMLGGPLNHTIAGITQALFEADTLEFKTYSKQIILNAKSLALNLKNFGFKLVTDGSDKHIILIDLRNKNVNAKILSKALSLANIISNKSTIPYETGSPINPSGLRLGTPTVTTRGMGEPEMKIIASLINDVTNIVSKFEVDEQTLEKLSNTKEILLVKEKVLNLCKKFPFNN